MSMIELSRFSMYYFSEVSADILYRYLPDGGNLHGVSKDLYKISATHPRNNVPISDWFHFADSTIGPKDDPLSFESENPVEPLALMAGRLWRGPESILVRIDEVDDPKRQFFSDFMCAIVFGEYDINDERANDYIHPSGDWLLSEYERLTETVK